MASKHPRRMRYALLSFPFYRSRPSEASQGAAERKVSRKLLRRSTPLEAYPWTSKHANGRGRGVG